MTSPVSVFSQGQPLIAEIEVDLKTSEAHQATAEVTRTAIEDGSLVSNHIVLQPDELEIAALVTNWDGNGAVSLGERAKTAWQEFKALMRRRELVDVVTQHELYEDMAIVSLNGLNEAPFAGQVSLTCRFEKVDRTQLSLVEIPESQLDPSVQKSASSEVDAGRIPPTTEQDNPQQAATVDNWFEGEPR